MKIFTIILFTLISQLLYCQNDIEIKIINDTIKKNSVFDVSNICYNITNTSDNPYYVVIDDKEFNTADDDLVEALFLGLPDYRLFNNNILMKPEFGIANIRNRKENKLLFPTDKELIKFRKKYKIKSQNSVEILISYRIFQNTRVLQPQESKLFCTNVNFPFYISPRSPDVKSYEMENGLPYFFQIFLNIPKEIIEKYFVAPQNSSKDIKIFKGTIYSNKVPLVYNVYNDR